MGRWVRLATMVFLLFLPAASIAQEIDLAKITPLIVGATQELREASIRTDLSAREYNDIMDMSCNTLTELALDDNFETLMKVYQERQYDEQLEEEIRDIFLNFRSFLEFVAVERGLLLDAGLSEAAVDGILGELMKVRLEAASFKLDAEVLLTDLRRLAEQACSASENVSEAVDDEMWCNMRRFGTFAAGAVAAIADGGALLVTKIPPAAATASGLAGSVVMSGAAMMPQC